MEKLPEDFLSPGAGLIPERHSATMLECDHKRSHNESNVRQTSEDNLTTDIPELRAIVRDLQGRFAGLPATRSRYRLSPHGFDRLCEYLEEADLTKVRYDYFVETQEFTLRMSPPSAKHEYVHTHTTLLIQEKFKQLCAQHQVQCPLTILSSTRVKDGHGSEFSPDNQLRCKTLKQPVLVMEIADSQSLKSLKNKAFRYIHAGKGKIRYVFALKLHTDSRAVDLVLATPKLTPLDKSIRLEADITTQAIRNAKGEPVSDAALIISVDRMVPTGLLPSSICRETIVVSAEELCEIVQVGEDFEEEIEEETEESSFKDLPADSVLESPPPSPSSSIELEGGGEDSDSEDEDEHAKRATTDDDEFKLDRRSSSGTPYRSPIKTRGKGKSKPPA